MKRIIGLVMILPATLIASAQDNYEIQVYGSQTQAKHSAIIELHSNFTFEGEKNIINGVLPSNHSLHETVEITVGIGNNFEIGGYLFTNYTPGSGYQMIGSHIRPRIKAPDNWNLPFGLSLSAEIGYQSKRYSNETWNVELRPIIDKQWKKFYISFNPTFGIALKSLYNNSVPVFEPALKLLYSSSGTFGLGIEYYGEMGSVNDFERLAEQNHALFFTADLLNNNKWELSAGAGFGLTDATDAFLIKVIIGRKILFKK